MTAADGLDAPHPEPRDRDIAGAAASIAQAPRDAGRLVVIVRRPDRGTRDTPREARLDPAIGLEGDDWLARGSRRTIDGRADPRVQLTLMSVRVLEAIEPDAVRWPLSGDQLLVDLDLSVESLPVGARLAIGDAIIEISEPPHTGCAKFAERFGLDALRWISTPEGKAQRRRGLNARIERAGTVRLGDPILRCE
jgi:hypothetical protein